ncbi:MAG: bifunctional phosphopantothenoylcysteine decarboxylase/phosphopantothenate--cysteine ligase CoaBC [Deltaproteobacteria bacterium]|jgi:phosphopantothenoylcysteine decarboxylase/phosphopantothenate--cysteine ligase|nr:bifunctional phosphopantothenoylcysteine decarboxylase/phosphopantothenate--cysteine ligase CoaBC [Deltaproteobacteria bacterium]
MPQDPPPATDPAPFPSGPESALAAKNILLIVTGGVAAYKAAYLARAMVKAGARVRVAMTRAATRFVAPLTFEALTGERAVADMWESSPKEIAHVAWAQWADLIAVAPATADFIAKIALGLAGDFPSATVLASSKPLLVAPAMNSGMFLNPVTQANLAALRERGATLVAPTVGALACGQIGVGRMAQPRDILLSAARALSPPLFRGSRFVVTAGATREAWDDIRFLSNRSTGKMGVALAQAAWLLGAEVKLIMGPTVPEPALRDPDFSWERIESARDLLAATRASLPDKGPGALLMAAAPADFRPAAPVAGKIKKADGALNLPLARTEDILKTLAAHKPPGFTMVGFAAESDRLLERAQEKLRAKSLDYVVANETSGPLGAFGADETTVTLLGPAGVILRVGKAPKIALALSVLQALHPLAT